MMQCAAENDSTVAQLSHWGTQGLSLRQLNIEVGHIEAKDVA